MSDQRAPDRLAWSIISTILCCWPLGIPSIVYSAKAMSANSAGNTSEAWDYSNKAKTWITINVVVWAVGMLAYLVVVLLFGGLAAFAGSGATP